MKVSKIIDNKEDGSITIEALFVMPIIFLIYFLISLSLFYLYDYNRMLGIANRTLYKCIFNLRHESDFETGKLYYEDIKNQGILYKEPDPMVDKEKEIEDYLIKKLSEGLFNTRITYVDVSVGKLKTNIKVEGEFNLPVGELLTVISANKKLLVKVNGFIIIQRIQFVFRNCIRFRL